MGVYVYCIKEDYSHQSLIKGREFENEWLKLDLDGTITIKGSNKQGYAWDGCSPKGKWKDMYFGTPEAVLNYDTRQSKTYYASLIHDVFYQFNRDIKHLVLRKEVDEEFYIILKRDGFCMARLYYLGVRALGWIWWRGRGRKVPGEDSCMKKTDQKTAPNGETKTVISVIALVVSALALYQSCVANKISRDISDITNRPYILINHIVANLGTRIPTDADIRLPIEYQFAFLNNGTLPAWVTQYDIYVNGTNGPIHLIFDTVVKPVKNFVIGKSENETRDYRSILIQKKVNDPNMHVDTFETEKYKMLLIVVTYKTLGDTKNGNIFTTWQLAKFGQFQNIECGTNSMTEKEIGKLFKEQEKIFELNEAK